MARADQQPGRRRAAPPPKRRLVKEPRVKEPRDKESRVKEPRPDRPARDPRPAREPRQAPSRPQVVRAWVGVTSFGLLLCLLGWTSLGVPGWITGTGAVLLTTSYAAALAARTGGRPVTSGALALALSALALLLEEPILLSGAAVGTAVLAALLGVMVTRPAAHFPSVVREVLIATGVAFAGAFAVEAYQAPVSVDRAGYLALGVALLGAVGLVYRLGAGFHGLGRRGAVAVGSGIGLLFVGLAYSEALSRWGTGDLTSGVGDFITWVHDTFGGVPRPVEFLLGFPALAWGVSTRARRRQGWWVCAFGAAGLAVVSTSLLNPSMPLLEALLILVYSLGLGLGLGYLVVRADSYLTGNRGRRARQLEEAAAHRPEPERTEALM